jgi:hypothetical protein
MSEERTQRLRPLPHSLHYSQLKIEKGGWNKFLPERYVLPLLDGCCRQLLATTGCTCKRVPARLEPKARISPRAQRISSLPRFPSFLRVGGEIMEKSSALFGIDWRSICPHFDNILTIARVSVSNNGYDK